MPAVPTRVLTPSPSLPCTHKRNAHQVQKGQADAKQLAKEKQRLGKMQQQLEVLEDEKTKTASRANSLLSFLGLGGAGSSKARAAADASASGGSSSSSAAGKQGLVSKSRGSLPPQQQQEKQPSGGSKNVLVQTWEALGQQLLQLEGKLSEVESNTQKQRLSVQQLKEKVRWGGVGDVCCWRQLHQQGHKFCCVGVVFTACRTCAGLTSSKGHESVSAGTCWAGCF